MKPSWFERLTGFREESPQTVREKIVVERETMTSRVNGKTMQCGRLDLPSLADLREHVQSSKLPAGRISVREIVANVQDLHTDKTNAGAMFQVASQFNFLEMVSPNVTPEDGIGIYENDRTQGPACAMAAGAGTIYRNYFVPVKGQLGQTANRQLDGLADIGEALGNDNHRLWEMRNGYALATRQGLTEISRRLRVADEPQRDELRQRLRIGVQSNTQVTLNDCQHTVSQTFCSALPVAYSEQSANLWEPFAKLILEGAYEATLCAAILNASRTANHQLFLTLLGGGAFGNATEWIIESLRRALKLYEHFPLDVAIVSYGSSKPEVQALLQELKFQSND